MMYFSSPGAFAAHLRRIQAGLPAAEERGMRAAAELIRQEARRVLGLYQIADTGPFAPWQPLAERTMDERRKQGYPDDEPLLRSGILRDSIDLSAESRRAAIGVADRWVEHPYRHAAVNIGVVALVLEMGNDRIPPRSFLGVAAYRKGEAAASLVGGHVAWHIAGLPPGTFQPRGGQR